MRIASEANGSPSDLATVPAAHGPPDRLEFVRETVQRMVAERSEIERQLAAEVSDSLGVAPATARLALRTLEREGAIASRGHGPRRSYFLPDASYLLPDTGSSSRGEANGHGRRRSRWLAIALVTVGALGLAEAAVTLLWQEPISALRTANAQADLGDELGALEASQGDRARERRAQALRAIDRRAVALNKRAEEGSPLGRLRVAALGLNYVVVQEASDESLTKGPAHYGETPLPGQRGDWTVGIAGHRTTYGAPFRHLDNLERGDEVILEMPYGRFVYSMERTKIVDADDTTVFQPEDYDRLALTACHPLYSDAERIIAYAKLKRIEVGGRTVDRAGRPA